MGLRWRQHWLLLPREELDLDRSHDTKPRGSLRSQSRAFRFLCISSLILPAIVIAGVSGVVFPPGLLAWVVSAAIISAVATGVLLMWAVRRVERDSSLARRDKDNWRKLIFLTGAIGAYLYLRTALRHANDGRERRTPTA